jgi:dUTPase
MVISKLPDVKLVHVETFTQPIKTSRKGGLGSTGVAKDNSDGA